MPEAPARPRETDLTLTPEARPVPRARSGRAPVRRGPVPRPAPPPTVARLREGLDAVLRHPAAIVGGVLVLAATAAVAVNALSFQNGRHPAPLFAKPAAPEARPVKAARASPPRDGIGELIRGDAQATASVAPREGAPPREAVTPREATPRPASPSQKSLASLPPPRPRAEVPPTRPEPAVAPGPKPPVSVKKVDAPRDAAGERKGDPQVMFAQKALVKLGYGPLAVDGVAGPATRAAIARFERERHLPGTPDVANRTLKELASRSGLAPH
ncbi:peptidoglycan-binding domain-containing protein [Methylobacterium sp. ID0610]|uniref:peptidoglycan-binding domain-containing protein n=1 Tax=Methylobacterium carpenticola TaxID=3344827 RepID=UPI003679AAE8